MESVKKYPPLVVILGETASGKSDLAVAMAQLFDGEVISADSRTVYKGLDVSTAKPNAAQIKAVPHHLIDILEPSEPYTAAQFKAQANAVIREVSGRTHLPILVGGSGLYIDALLYDFTFGQKADAQQREQLNGLSVEDLQMRLKEESIALPANSRNPRHLIRALETKGEQVNRSTLRPNTLILGLTVEKEILKSRIESRAKNMLRAGFVEEIKVVATAFGWDAPALQSPGCKAVKAYLKGAIDFSELEASLVREHLRLAKRQRTWFKRNKGIRWISKKDESEDLITTFLNN